MKDMNSKLYKHKKTGKLYSLVQEDIKVKTISNIIENEPYYEWIGGNVLYKAEYDSPEGPYFVRTKEDFYDSFELVNNQPC